MPTMPQRSSSSPNFARVGAHAGLDGEHVAAQRLGRRPLAEQGPGLSRVMGSDIDSVA